MNEYQLPEEPAGPVWDQHGSRWVRIPETYPVLWKTDDDACHPTWGRLLEEYGPLSENAPVKRAGKFVASRWDGNIPWSGRKHGTSARAA